MVSIEETMSIMLLLYDCYVTSDLVMMKLIIANPGRSEIQQLQT